MMSPLDGAERMFEQVGEEVDRGVGKVLKNRNGLFSKTRIVVVSGAGEALTLGDTIVWRDEKGGRKQGIVMKVLGEGKVKGAERYEVRENPIEAGDLKTYHEIGYYKSGKYHKLRNIYGMNDRDAWEAARDEADKVGHVVVLVGGGSPISIPPRRNNPKTKLDLMLDQVEAGKREITFDTDGYSEAQRDRIIQTAEARGLHAASDGRFILVRNLGKTHSGQNPAVSASQYGMAQAVLSGRSKAMPKKVARELVDRTPEYLRSEFAEELAGRRGNPSNNTWERVGYETGYEKSSGWTELPGKDYVTAQAHRKLSDASETYGLWDNALPSEKKEAVREFVKGFKRGFKDFKLGKTRKNNPGPLSVISYKGGKGGHAVAQSKTANEVRNLLKSGQLGDLNELTVWEAGRQTYPGLEAASWLSYNDYLRTGKRNPEAEAADMYESFHGKPSEEVLEFVEDERYHGNLAGLGVLTEMKVITLSGYDVTLPFAEDAAGDGRENPESIEDQLVDLLWSYMKKDPEHKDRVQTGWGTKTQIGLGLTVKRFASDSKELIEGLWGYLRGSGDRRNTGYGTKTKEGLVASIQRITEGRGAGMENPSLLERLKRLAGHGSSTWVTYETVPTEAAALRLAGELEARGVRHAKAVKVRGGYDVRLLREGIRSMARREHGGSGPVSSSSKGGRQKQRLSSYDRDVEDLRAQGLDVRDGKIVRVNPSLSKSVLLCSNEDGNQLYFMGGDQSLNLKSIHMDGKWERDSMVIGVLYEVTYRTEKKFDKFKLTDYYHKLGEETGEEPTLRYDKLNERLYVDGGQYRISKPLLGVSPGIEN